MKRPFEVCIFLLLALAASGLLTAQGGDAEQEVRTVLKQMIDADLKVDAAALQETLTYDFNIVTENGIARNRAETLDGIRSGSTKFESFDAADVQVRIYGDTALVTFVETIKGSRAGKNMSGQFREVRVFVRGDRNWRAVLAQRTRIAS
jgi:type V secretory pathway adhesin AidA